MTSVCVKGRKRDAPNHQARFFLSPTQSNRETKMIHKSWVFEGFEKKRLVFWHSDNPSPSTRIQLYWLFQKLLLYKISGRSDLIDESRIHDNPDLKVTSSGSQPFYCILHADRTHLCTSTSRVANLSRGQTSRLVSSKVFNHNKRA